MSYVSFSGDGGQVDQYYNYWLVKGFTVHSFSGHFPSFFEYLFSALLT